MISEQEDTTTTTNTTEYRMPGVTTMNHVVKLATSF